MIFRLILLSWVLYNCRSHICVSMSSVFLWKCSWWLAQGRGFWDEIETLNSKVQEQTTCVVIYFTCDCSLIGAASYCCQSVLHFSFAFTMWHSGEEDHADQCKKTKKKTIFNPVISLLHLSTQIIQIHLEKKSNEKKTTEKYEQLVKYKDTNNRVNKCIHQ